jgi:hypothetical protein
MLSPAEDKSGDTKDRFCEMLDLISFLYTTWNILLGDFNEKLWGKDTTSFVLQSYGTLRFTPNLPLFIYCFKFSLPLKRTEL